MTLQDPNRIRAEFNTLTIQQLIATMNDGHLSLTPVFQRESVWKEKDRKRLIESIFEGYPVPSIFLYRRDEDGIPVYEVVDGKQRLETIFMFVGIGRYRGHRFEADIRVPGTGERRRLDWAWLARKRLTEPFLTYRFQTVEVTGELGEIIDLFVRINSTGKILTGAEKRKARSWNSPVLKQAEKLGKRYIDFLSDQGVISRTQEQRLKHVELLTELLVSFAHGGPIHKKTAVDAALKSRSIDQRSLQRASEAVAGTLRTMGRMFSNLRETRFAHIPEFYSLALVLYELRRENRALNEVSRLRQAGAVLRRFSMGVDLLRDKAKHYEAAGPDDAVFRAYLDTTRQSTDSLAARKERGRILAALLAGIFERRDNQRLFSPEQRRILWGSSEKRRCQICEEPLDWTNYQVDHIKPHSRGGKTALGNAQVACARCNRKKGAGRARRG